MDPIPSRGSLAALTVTGAVAGWREALTPLRLADFERYQAVQLTPLSLKVERHTVFNMSPPIQGLASLLLLGVYDRLKISTAKHSNTCTPSSKPPSRHSVCATGTSPTRNAWMLTRPNSWLLQNSMRWQTISIWTRRCHLLKQTQKDDMVWLRAIDDEDGSSDSFKVAIGSLAPARSCRRVHGSVPAPIIHMLSSAASIVLPLLIVKKYSRGISWKENRASNC